ncbi:2-oxo acid dehydrogenase subunit E2, partial [Shewanella sp. MBTL60-112-B1]|uniref:2-oxo acid dehydrogenase subunit E2 n=1 Tax=Shewanella sp. MBTL60-112-B1 TaxID=2815916 RepID=UPI00217FEE71
RLTTAARSGRVSPNDLKGGSISISNIGALGGTVATPIINKPEGAIALQSVIGLGLDDNALDNIASPTALPLEHQDTNLTVIAAN